MISFEGKNVIVTGGSRGIGAAIVRMFSKLGAGVAYNYHKNLHAAERLQTELQKYGTDVYFADCDVRDFREVRSFVRNAIEKLGTIHILVNNAGIWEYGPIDKMSVDQWRKTMQTNLDGTFYFTREVVAHMLEQSIAGHIINIASTAGQRGEPYYSHYAATKGALISFTKSLAAELGPRGIHVNCVAPGWVKTDMTEKAMAQQEKEIVKGIPLGFVGEADDIAGPVIFLASNLARYINGEILNVNGGNVLCG
ncbi:SDR family NAD(P)-dependent oxidoreductase [Caldithrix abyssi]|uniref:3-oxoacyl-(Acyl-carrier protein) reductase n=1 Tax=Caldithrix abyssi DSM 13497 TaxID=880073 RepID=H1XU95_CALAY|nr:3-oxoacyl-ACP reductase family protein [Caldithrix abyssi]APF17485.1 3-oxoacyl-(acyl-carrier protein) reductase [Caldithrix abyssi DSM 13497]EHO41585.1 short-chain dehydrogenase/reductase SDR [Caldithrix abyssi DSM 13497]